MKMNKLLSRPSNLKRRRRSVFLLSLRLCCRLQWLVKLYLYEAPATERPHKDLDGQPIRIKYEYGQVNATTTG